MKTYPSLKSCDYLYMCLGAHYCPTGLQVHSGQVSVGLVRGSEDCSCTYVNMLPVWLNRCKVTNVLQLLHKDRIRC